MIKVIKKYIPYKVRYSAKFLYKNYIQWGARDYRKFHLMIKKGKIVLIPSGFRCWTKGYLFSKLDINQPSLPFDWGFFPPTSIVNVLNDPKINLKYPDDESTHKVCIKYEDFTDPKLGLGIKFETSSYEDINLKATCKNMEGINKYLDDTYGYYTLDIKNKFLLAHYNWHPFSGKSADKCKHSECIKKINRTLNKRIERMFELCNSAEYIFFVVRETQKYKYMMIDKECYDLYDLDELTNTVRSKFQSKCFVVKAEEIDTPSKILSMICT